MTPAELSEISRYIVTASLIGCAVVVKLSSNIIDSKSLSSNINKVFKILVIIVFLRFLAIAIDSYFDLTLPIFSTTVGTGLFIYIFYLAFRFYMTLKTRDDELHKTEGSILYVRPLDKEKIQTLIDGLFTELGASKIKTNTLQRDIEATLKKYE